MAHYRLASLLFKQPRHSSVDFETKQWKAVSRVQMSSYEHAPALTRIFGGYCILGSDSSSSPQCLHFFCPFISDQEWWWVRMPPVHGCFPNCLCVSVPLPGFSITRFVTFKKILSTKYFCYSMMSCLERLINILQNIFLLRSSDSLTLMFIFFRLAVSKWFLFPTRYLHPL